MNAHYNFTVEQDSQYSKITYKKSPIQYKAIVPFCIIYALPAVILAFAIGADSLPTGVILWIFLMVLFSSATVFIINALRGKGSFSIGENKIIANNKTYDLKDVSLIAVQDPFGKYEQDTIITIQSTYPSAANVAHGFASANQHNVRAIKRIFSESSYKIIIRHGTKDVVIARQLNEVEADVLWKRVSELATLNK